MFNRFLFSSCLCLFLFYHVLSFLSLSLSFSRGESRALSVLNLPLYVQQVPLLVLSLSFSFLSSFVLFVIVLVFLQRRGDVTVCPKLPPLRQFPPSPWLQGVWLSPIVIPLAQSLKRERRGGWMRQSWCVSSCSVFLDKISTLEPVYSATTEIPSFCLIDALTFGAC